MEFREDRIMSVADLVRNIKKIREELKEKDILYIFKNGKPDLILMSLEEYKSLQKVKESKSNINNFIKENLDSFEMVCLIADLVNFLDDKEISKEVLERYKHDNGIRHSLEEVMKLQKEKGDDLIDKQIT